MGEVCDAVPQYSLFVRRKMLLRLKLCHKMHIEQLLCLSTRKKKKDGLRDDEKILLFPVQKLVVGF